MQFSIFSHPTNHPGNVLDSHRCQFVHRIHLVDTEKIAELSDLDLYPSRLLDDMGYVLGHNVVGTWST